MKSQKPTLIFVYNADGDLFSSLVDATHKIISPKTYSCNLCAITYGPLSMKKEWKTFIKNFSLSVKFLHRDEFRKKYPKNKETFPSVFIKKDEQPELIISSTEIDKCKSLKDLTSLVNQKTKEFI